MGIKIKVSRRKKSRPRKRKKRAEKKGMEPKNVVKTEIPGLDQLFLSGGLVKGSSILVSGGPGTCKTIFCLQTLYNAASKGHDCVYLTLEEAPSRLKSHMEDFGFNVKETKRDENAIYLRANKGRIAIKRLEPIGIARSVEAMLEKASGRLPVDINIVLELIPPGFNPHMLALDSISAMETAFSGRIEQYRIYIEQLFRYFEKLNTTSFLVTETVEAPYKYSKTGVEEFLADGIVAFYYFRAGQSRLRGVEVVKMRGNSHSSFVAPLTISEHGLVVSLEGPGAHISAKKAEFSQTLKARGTKTGTKKANFFEVKSPRES
ncbi:MAG: ATPase domain-containing protein [Candidatus Hadarchaeota archaeon]|nr:ATPase domain-containing protein [Candidatus Hadarchaeota archaeon]